MGEHSRCDVSGPALVLGGGGAGGGDEGGFGGAGSLSEKLVEQRMSRCR